MPVRRITEALRGTPFENQVWLVGGCVRDELLGRNQSADLDLVTELPVTDLISLIEERIVLEHPPVIFANFGTAMLTIEGQQFEFVQARKESYSPDSRKPSTTPATLIEDAQRRDFTCNTLLKNLHSGEIFDPLDNGVSDLRAGILRTPLDPVMTFRDDPLRMLRAVRFRWKLGFDYAPGLAESIRKESSRLTIVSGERVRDEFFKMLQGPKAHLAVKDLMELNLLNQFFPEFSDGIGMSQGPYHHLDVWDHTCMVLEQCDGKPLITKLAALFHDVAKPTCRSVEPDGKIRFFGHEIIGEELTRKMLARLKPGNELIADVALLVRHHMRILTLNQLSPKTIRRLARDVQNLLEPLLDLVEADRKSQNPAVVDPDMTVIRERIRDVLTSTPKEVLTSPLDGKEIMGILGIQAGLEIGRAKDFLLQKVLDGDLKPGDKEGAAQFLKSEFLDC